MGKNEKRFFSSVLMLSLISGTCFAQHPRVTQLIAEKQAKMKKLEDCQGTTKKLKIAGISTLGITAVGVAGNIAEAVILKDAKSDLAESQKAYKEQDTIRKEREACIQKGNYEWVGGKCEKAQKAPAEETPAEEAPAEEAPAEEAPAEEAPAEEAPAEEAPAEEAPAEEAGAMVSDSAIPDWFKEACYELSAEIKGTKCEKVDEPKTPQQYIDQVTAFASETLFWKNPNKGYKFGLCPIKDNKYTCTFKDTSINTTYILSREVSVKKVKCENTAQTFDPQTKQCIQKDSTPQNQQQAKLNLNPVNMRTGGANRQTQKEYCKKIGKPSDNDCIYTGATIEIENDFQESVTQILNNAKLKYIGITPSTSEYVVKAVAPDDKTYLSIRIDKNKVTCKDTTKTLTPNTYQCVGANEDTNALQRAQPKNSVSKEDLITLCVVAMKGIAGNGNADTNTCSLLAKDAGHMKTLKKHIEENSDARCDSYSDNEVVICNDKKSNSVTITIKKQSK